MKAIAKINLNKKVEIVASHICCLLFFESASSEMCIPSESESESAIAIIIIPPKIIDFECVLEFKPMINPSVVIIPEVSPNPKPFFIEFLILSNF